jgi:hypothetical protein
MNTLPPLFGVYKLAPKQIAYRQDYCIHCQCNRVAFLDRYWGILHIVFVPILPLGRVRSWRCSSCNLHPRLKAIPLDAWRVILAFVAFVPMTFAFWCMTPEPDTAETIWLCRGLLSVGVIWLAWWISGQMRAPGWVKQRAKEAGLVSTNICIRCGSGMVSTEPAHCPACGLERRES